MARYSPDPKDGGFFAWSNLPTGSDSEKDLRVFFGFSAELDPNKILVIDEERQYVDLVALDINGKIIVCYDEIVTYRLHGPVLVVAGDDKDADKKIAEFYSKNRIVHEAGKPPRFGNGATVIYADEDTGA